MAPNEISGQIVNAAINVHTVLHISLWLPLFQNPSRDTSFCPMTKYGAQKAAVDAHSTRGPETILDSRRPPSARLLRVLRALCVLRGDPFPSPISAPRNPKFARQAPLASRIVAGPLTRWPTHLFRLVRISVD